MTLSRATILMACCLLPLAGCGESGTPYGGGKAPGTAPARTDAAAPEQAKASWQAAARDALARGATLLRSLQGEDGQWGDPEIELPGNVGYTAMVLAGLSGSVPREARASDAALSKAVAALLKAQKEDGSVWDNPRFVTYQTSAVISALSMLRRPDLASVQARARDFLAASQIQGSSEDPSFGGFPYQSKVPQAADLSNLQFAADALAASGLPADHPVWQRIQTYLQRVQNRSEGNVIELQLELEGEKVTVVAGNDGGSAYAPDQSKAGTIKRPDGKVELRSYGSMTYALLKCLLLSGVQPADPRAVAALGWISRNWTLDRNPGFEQSKDPTLAGQQGLYYYFFTLARTLALYERVTKQPLVVQGADGRRHDWRASLAQRLVALQRPDGGWRNEVAERWDEGSRTLATAYATQALALALGELD